MRNTEVYKYMHNLLGPDVVEIFDRDHRVWRGNMEENHLDAATMSEIVGIGVDMIEISRVLAAYSKESFRKRHFTEESSSLLLTKKLVRQRPLLQKKLS